MGSGPQVYLLRLCFSGSGKTVMYIFNKYSKIVYTNENFKTSGLEKVFEVLLY